MKKHIYIISLHLGFGGIEKAIVNMANLFCEKYSVTIMSVYRLAQEPAYKLNEKVEVVYLTSVLPNKQEFLSAVHQKNIFLVLKEGFKSLKILYLKKISVKKAIKSIDNGIIITTRNEDNIMLSKYGKPNVLKIAQLHQDYTTDKNLTHDFAKKYHQIDEFIVLTKQLEYEIKEIMKLNTHINISTIPNFMDHDVDNVILANKEKYAISVGRFHTVKGFDRLIKIFAMVHKNCPDWKLVLIGEGEEESKIRELIHHYNLDDFVVLTGKLNSEEIEKWEKKSSVYLMTSYSEGLPFVLIEAFSCKLPAIAFDVRVGPRAVIDHGENGYLIEDGDINQYADSVIDLMQNQEKREAFAEAAYIKINEFSREHVRTLWYDILSKGEMKDVR